MRNLDKCGTNMIAAVVKGKGMDHIANVLDAVLDHERINFKAGELKLKVRKICEYFMKGS